MQRTDSQHIKPHYPTRNFIYIPLHRTTRTRLPYRVPPRSRGLRPPNQGNRPNRPIPGRKKVPRPEPPAEPLRSGPANGLPFFRPSVFLFCGPPMRMNRRIPPRKSGETLPFFTPPQPHGDPRGAQKRCLNNKKVSKQQFENSLFDKDV